MSLDTIRLSQKAKDRLIVLKRRTGISQWNILCRWALCRSLAEENPPPDHEIKTDSNVEIAWSTFGGEYAGVYLALLKARCLDDEGDVSEELLNATLTRHLHRGINYLFTEIDGRNIAQLLQFSSDIRESDFDRIS